MKTYIYVYARRKAPPAFLGGEVYVIPHGLVNLGTCKFVKRSETVIPCKLIEGSYLGLCLSWVSEQAVHLSPTLLSFSARSRLLGAAGTQSAGGHPGLGCTS